MFQKLEGEVTVEGLWLRSTMPDAPGGCFRVAASAVRKTANDGASVPLTQPVHEPSGSPPCFGECANPLASTGMVKVEDQVVRFVRPGLVEEYSVSVDGVRQDLVVLKAPGGAGPLRVELEVTGTRVEPLSGGARLVLAESGRKLNYHRLRVTDAAGRELVARMEVVSATRLAVVVEDAGAVYPVRIDPTFSDANWISMGGLPGTDGVVSAMAVDSSGSIYIGGAFVVVGDVAANYVAKWNGSSWSALGSGMNGGGEALAVSGSELYAGGAFTNAGGVRANNIAKWNGSSWSAIGSGMSGPPFNSVSSVSVLAVSGGELYAGGAFTNAGGVSANNIAKWNGSAWSAFGSGMNGGVRALAFSGSDL